MIMTADASVEKEKYVLVLEARRWDPSCFMFSEEVNPLDPVPVYQAEEVDEPRLNLSR